MKKISIRIIAAVLLAMLVFTLLTACSDDYRPNPTTEDDIKYDLVKVMEDVRVADGFFATYASIIPSVFVEDKWSLTYETKEVDGKEVYIAIVSGEYYPDYRDHGSTKTGTIKFMMDLFEKKHYRQKAPWPYEDPDNIDDIIWQFVTHKDPSER